MKRQEDWLKSDDKQDNQGDARGQMGYVIERRRRQARRAQALRST